MRSLYLDTNIYLSFYHLSNDDIEELKKLLHLVRGDDLELYLPVQTKDEFTRNRDVKIADSLKRFNENKLNNLFPQIVKDFDTEFKEMKDSIKKFEKNKQQIIKRLGEAIKEQELNADKIIKNLFSAATEIPITDNLLNKAKNRFDLGNPPGKKGSYGDALNWESLVSFVKDVDEFNFVSEDKDYYSEVDKDAINHFLKLEWSEKHPKITLKTYKSLSSFLKEHYPDISIASEIEKEELIRSLYNSPSFASTRKLLIQISNYDDFTKKQLNDIVEASIHNSQINWIGTDEDINDMLYSILEGNDEKIEQNNLNQFKKEIPKRKDNDEDLPF
ncbi:MAG: PIN domain-containing protein [Bacteroidota bacterium]